MVKEQGTEDSRQESAGQGVHFTNNVEQWRCVNRILYIKHINAFYLNFA
jgi:hypothetical protein